MDVQSKARRQAVSRVRARLNELDRAQNYLGSTTYYWTRKRILEAEMAELKKEVYRTENIDLSSEDKIEQYLVIVI